MAAAAPVSERVIVVDASLTPSNAQMIAYQGGKGVTAGKCEYNGFHGSHPLHGFVLTAHEAFSRHMDLVWTPDDFWCLVVQGLGHLINQDPEKYRSQLVQHKEGKEIVRVIRDGWVPGQTTGKDWEGVCHELAQRTVDRLPAESLGTKLLTAFSTTTSMHHLLYAGGILSALQGFFKYVCASFCGIPRFVLRGSGDDWIQLVTKIEALKLSEIDPAWKLWETSLLTIVRQLVQLRTQEHAATAEQITFLKHFYKYGQRSGGTYVTGWITCLFPLLGEEKVTANHFQSVSWEGDCKFPSVGGSCFPSGLTDVPFVWKTPGTDYQMRMYIGFDEPSIGFGQDRIETRLGFAVQYG